MVRRRFPVLNNSLAKIVGSSPIEVESYVYMISLFFLNRNYIDSLNHKECYS